MTLQSQSDHMDELLVKYLTGQADIEERRAALDWIRQSEEHRADFEKLKKIYLASKLSQPDTIYNPERSWKRVKATHSRNMEQLQHVEEPVKRFRLPSFLKYAAGVAVFCTLGILGYHSFRNRPDNQPIVWSTVEAPYGSRSKVTLADGTQVWLNAGSQLKYASSFGSGDRKVYLNGEAYFAVTHSKTQFVVNTQFLEVRVHGTEFNVKAYNEEDYIQTTLVKGSVSIVRKHPSRAGRHKVMLKPNQTATFNIHSKKFVGGANNTDPIKDKQSDDVMEVSSGINPVIYTSWKDSRWLIEGEPLSSLAVKLERRYNVNISFSSPELESYRFTGTLTDETLDQVLHVIQLSAPIRYEINDHEVTLFENKPAKDSYDELLIRN
jgi:ferric-dicitrate binding protein FerR (iron transport regulator)